MQKNEYFFEFGVVFFRLLYYNKDNINSNEKEFYKWLTLKK